MSTDLETLLRDAADGPTPALDVADLRRRGTRRRYGRRVVEAGGVAAVVGLALAVVPDLVAPTPDVRSLSAPDPSAATAGDRPGFEVAVGDEGWCALWLVEGEELLAVSTHDAGLDGGLCGAGAPVEVVRDAVSLYVELPADPDDPGATERRHVGLVDGGVAEVVLTLDDGAEVRVATAPVRTPGDLPLADFAVALPQGREAVQLTAFDEAGRELYRRQPPVTSEDVLAWGLQNAADYEAPSPRIDDLTEWTTEVVPPDPSEDVPPLGTWRPAASPVDLSPLSMETPSEIWYLDGEPATENLADADAIAGRLGSPERFEELCVFLTEQVETAHRELDLAGADPNHVAEALTYLVLGEAQVRGGDGLTLAVAIACGIADGPRS